VPRLALAAIVMGVVLFFLAPMIQPYLSGSIVRRVGGLIGLVGAGVAVYGLACFLTGGFVVEDLKLMMRRTRET
jgi:putative peptidoglycan lipid II flippase